nr:hypothetical protein [Anaerolineae bacterium]
MGARAGEPLGRLRPVEDRAPAAGLLRPAAACAPELPPEAFGRAVGRRVDVEAYLLQAAAVPGLGGQGDVRPRRLGALGGGAGDAEVGLQPVEDEARRVEGNPGIHVGLRDPVPELEVTAPRVHAGGAAHHPAVYIEGVALPVVGEGDAFVACAHRIAQHLLPLYAEAHAVGDAAVGPHLQNRPFGASEDDSRAVGPPVVVVGLEVHPEGAVRVDHPPAAEVGEVLVAPSRGPAAGGRVPPAAAVDLAQPELGVLDVGVRKAGQARAFHRVRGADLAAPPACQVVVLQRHLPEGGRSGGAEPVRPFPPAGGGVLPVRRADVGEGDPQVLLPLFLPPGGRSRRKGCGQEADQGCCQPLNPGHVRISAG